MRLSHSRSTIYIFVFVIAGKKLASVNGPKCRELQTRKSVGHIERETLNLIRFRKYVRNSITKLPDLNGRPAPPRWGKMYARRVCCTHSHAGLQFKLRPFSTGSILTLRKRIEPPASTTSVERTPRKIAAARCFTRCTAVLRLDCIG